MGRKRGTFDPNKQVKGLCGWHHASDADAKWVPVFEHLLASGTVYTPLQGLLPMADCLLAYRGVTVSGDVRNIDTPLRTQFLTGNG